MKVFISSVINGFEQYRAAVEDAVETLGHEVVRAEDFDASSDSPRVACLEGVRRADMAILLLGARYGARQESGLSATHEEFREARDRKEVLAFVEQTSDREPDQVSFISEVQDWSHGLFTQDFTSADTLRRLVIRVLHARTIEEARGPSEMTDLVDRLTLLFPRKDSGWSSGRVSVVVALAAGPPQTMLRPAEIERETLADSLYDLGLTGRHKIFDRREGTATEVVQNSLTIKQPTRWLTVHGDGSLVAGYPAETGEMGAALVDETVAEAIQRLIGLFNDVLADIDSNGRIRHVCVGATIDGAGHLGWRTRDEERRSPHAVRTGFGGIERHPVSLAPPVRPRAAIRTQAAELSEDLTVLLRRQFQP